MKWYTCLNEESLSAYIDHLRVAIASAIDVGRLQAHVLYDGDPDKLIDVLGSLNLSVDTFEADSQVANELAAIEAQFTPQSEKDSAYEQLKKAGEDLEEARKAAASAELSYHLAVARRSACDDTDVRRKAHSLRQGHPRIFGA